MANKSFIYAANEHFAIVRCSDVPSDIEVPKSKHPEIAETAAFLAINNWRRLFEFIERYAFVAGRVPMFYRPFIPPYETASTSRFEYGGASLDDPVRERFERNARNAILGSCATTRNYRMRDYNSMDLRRYLESLGVNYLSADFAERLLKEYDEQNEDFLLLNISELMKLRDELGAIVMAASISLGSEKSFSAYGKLLEDGEGFAQGYALDALYRAKENGVLDEVSDNDRDLRLIFRFEPHGRTGFELVKAAAANYVIDALYRFHDGEAGKCLNHVFSNSKVDDRPLKARAWNYSFTGSGYVRIPTKHALVWAQVYADAVEKAVRDGRVFTCAECGTPCIGIQTFQDSESKFCSASCKTASSKRNPQSADNA